MASWIRLSFARRLYLWLVGYSLLLAGCMVAFQYNREREFKASALDDRLQLVNTYIAAEIAHGTAVDSITSDYLAPFPDIRLSVIDPSGHVVYDNTVDSLPGSDHLGREEIAGALRAGHGYALRRHSASTGETYFYSATRGPGGMVVRTAVPYSVSLSRVLAADWTFVWIMGGIAFLFCMLGLVATRRVGMNVRRLSRFAARAESGERITGAEPFPHDELGDISSHIVRLYARLQQAVSDRDRQHAEAMHQQREKERIKKQLTNNINHELKTPVASVRLCLETLLAHPDMEPAKRREFLERSLAGTARLSRLLEDVSLITRMDEGGAVISREPLDLAAVIAEAVADTAPLAGSRGVTVTDLVEGPLPIVANRGLMTSVFVNLIDNAVVHSGGDSVVVTTRAVRRDRVILTVSDNGHGVAPEHLDRLFERFYRVDKGRSRASGGTGLGLSIVRNAVVMHGGSISVSNLRRGGLSFTITLPLDFTKD